MAITEPNATIVAIIVANVSIKPAIFAAKSFVLIKLIVVINCCYSTNRYCFASIYYFN